MSRRLAFLTALGLGSAALAADPIALQTLTPTSGTGAELLLDGNPATGWSPEGDPAQEGVLLRFEKPVSLDGVSLRTCTGAPELQAALYLNGTEALTEQKIGAEAKTLPFGKRELRSLFVRLQSAGGAKACLGEVTLLQGGKPQTVKAPRTVAGRIEASSVLTPADAYAPGFLFDGRLDFGWAEGSKGPGTGESFTLTLEAPVELTALELWNGYQRSEDHFQKNARAKKLSLSVDGGAPVPLGVKDSSGAQTLKLPAPMKGRVWKLSVDEVYPGKRYPDMVLSELRLVDAQGPLGVRTPDGDERKRALETGLAGSPLGKVANQRWRGLCAPEAVKSDRQFKLRTNNTFVFYDDSDDATWSASEVLDGAWVVKQASGPWAAVELFGRRHRSETNWDPYADTQNKDTVRIAGGKLEVARVADLGRKEFEKLVAEWSKGTQSGKVECVGQEGHTYEDLVKADAFVVRGTAVTDLFARE
ncbi:NADase-type glycan-binding domain-containing protein [Archangium sp.]|uniref:NADase-type glycan-binding domain-containing protein n=1 Tax=Archangium sp. TaxID=1872627 RepID=UPI00389A625F